MPLTGLRKCPETISQSIIFGLKHGIKRPFVSKRAEEPAMLPHAGDILYGNPEAIANRIQLFHLLRLQTQERIDRKMLTGRHFLRITTDWLHFIDVGQRGQKGIRADQLQPCIRVTTYYKSRFPGIERQYDPSQAKVKVAVSIKSLEFETHQLQRLQSLLHAGDSTVTVQKGHFSFSISDFPFQSQNRQRAMNIVQNLIVEARRPLTEQLETCVSGEEKDYTRSIIKKRPKLSFPMRWLENNSREKTPTPI